MNINLSKKLITSIKYHLFYSGEVDIFNKFEKAVADSHPKEINYKNYGLDELVDDIKEYRKKINGTNLNYKDLGRDESGRFLPVYKKIYHFKYNSPNTGIKDREIKLESKDETYICGADLGDNGKIKNFRRDRVIGRVRVEKIKI